MGWNGSDGKKTSLNQNKAKHSYLLGGKVVIVVSLFFALGIVFWFCLKNDVFFDNKTKDLMTNDNTTLVTKKKKSNIAKPVSEGLKEVHKGNSYRGDEEKPEVEKLDQLDINLDSLPKPPPPLQTSHFTHASDQVISMAVNTEGAIAPIPLDANFDVEFKKSLKEKIIINDDDPEDVKRSKENVIAVREELKKLMDQGMSPREALEAHRDEINHIFETRAMVVQEARKIERESGQEEADEFLKLANDYLQSKGMESVKLRRRNRQ